MKQFKRASYKYGEIEELNQISCNSALNVDGAEGIYEVDITIGTELGSTGLRYESFNIPDRFQLFFDGNLVADSKYVGGSLSTYKNTLLNTTNKVLSIFIYDGTTFIDSGLMETISITNSDIASGIPSEPTAGKGEIKFNKIKSDVTVMKLRVTGALGGTLWNAAPLCPTTITTTTPTTGSNTTSYKTYDLIYHSYITTSSCEELEQGTIGQYYSKGNLVVGTKLYTNKQLTNLMPSGYAFLGRTIYEVNQGVIIDIYPCSKAPII